MNEKKPQAGESQDHHCLHVTPTIVSRKYTPPFATLALVQIARGGLSWDATFSLAITPSLDQEMFSVSVDAGFVLALPSHHGDLEPDCVGVSTRGGGRGQV